MAVGARRADVVWTFLRRGTLLAATGAGIGLVGAIAVSGTIRSLLYGVGPRDAVSLLAGTAVVMTIALAASLVPALRAARTDPLSALRHR
jgi:ABC-type antimicrobial peptide transport system permease subunit